MDDRTKKLLAGRQLPPRRPVGVRTVTVPNRGPITREEIGMVTTAIVREGVHEGIDVIREILVAAGKITYEEWDAGFAVVADNVAAQQIVAVSSVDDGRVNVSVDPPPAEPNRLVIVGAAEESQPRPGAVPSLIGSNTPQ